MGEKMLASGSQQIIGSEESHKMGLEEVRMNGVTIEGRPTDGVADELTDLSEGTHLFQATILFDIFVELYCQDKEHYDDFLNN